MAKKFDYQKNVITIDEAMEMLGFSNVDKFVSTVDKHIPSHKIDGDIDMYSISEVRSLAKALEKELFIPYEIKERCVMFEKDIPPEKKEEQKKYVPFEDMDEFLTAYMRQDVTRLSPRDTIFFVRGFWLKFDSEYIQIIAFSEKTILTSYFWENFESMFEKFTFLDNSPCGKEVSNE